MCNNIIFDLFHEKFNTLLVLFQLFNYNYVTTILKIFLHGYLNLLRALFESQDDDDDKIR